MLPPQADTRSRIPGNAYETAFVTPDERADGRLRP
jgi:hypothetical protein